MKSFAAIAASAVLMSATALAGPGDVHRVTADLVNLRAAPSDSAAIRDQIEGGTEVLELRRDGGWYGVRVVETGQEGWIYSGLLSRVVASNLAEERQDHGFGALSGDFDRLIGDIEGIAGLDMVETVARSDDTLTVTPTVNWLLASSEDAQILATAAVYQMWKNYRNNAPSRVVMLDPEGDDYVVVEDREEGPAVIVNRQASGRDREG